MSTESKTPLVLSVLFVALILGLLSDILLRGVPWGANVPIWIAFLISGLFLAKHLGHGKLEFGSVLLIIPMAVFSICFAWRDSTTLKNLDLSAILFSAALIITRQSQPFWSPTISKMFRSIFNLAGHCVGGFVHLLARDMDWTQRRNAAVAANVRGAAAGVVIAIPLLLVFSFLFMRADAAFENLMRGLLDIRIGEHLAATFIGTWIAGSYLRAALLTEPITSTAAEPKIKLGPIELNVALALLNILFATFVAVQTQYLFGNAATIESTPGLTYSSYARRGFFELVAVALLVLPILLAADRWHACEKSKRLLRTQSLLLVALVGCVIVSAMHRMRLYQNEYGLTELRWYTMAFMVWLAALFALFCVTVLRDRRPVFVACILATGFTAILVLHALNPDQRIAASQLANAKAGRRFDSEYFRKLSADAVPIVTANANLLPAHDREVYREEKRGQFSKPQDIRSWNYSRSRAQKALSATQ